MTRNKNKQIVVIKNIPSNIVEEVFLVLRNPKAMDVKRYLNNRQMAKNKEFLIIKEAEMIIEDFAQNVQPKKNIPNGTLDLFINVSLVTGIAIFIYLLCRMF
jgi:hypothetical protein